MNSLRRVPLTLFLIVVLALTATLSTLAKSTNVVATSVTTNHATATALYCTGLSSAKGADAGHVTFLNTTDFSRVLTIDVVGDNATSASEVLSLGAHAARTLQPESLVKANSYAVAVAINGPGVVGEQVTDKNDAETPCATTGVTGWYANGFDTTVGSSADISLYNPTATPAVFNITTYSPSGFSAPSTYQGLAVGAHGQLELSLGAQIVNTTNIGVRVNVLRGSIVAEGIQQSGPVVSFNAGTTTLSETSWFPAVTTVNGALAQIRVMNPNNQPATLTASVQLASYTVAPQTLTVAPFASADIVITPNSAIPAAGYASIALSSNQPVATSLLTGTTGATGLSGAVAPSNAFLIGDFAGQGYDAALVTNTSSKTTNVTFSTVPSGGQKSVSATVELAGNSTQSIEGLFPDLTTFKATTVLVTGTRANLVVALTLPSKPAGVTVVAPLDGR